MQQRRTAPESNLLRELRALGTMCTDQGDLKRAEQHFRLALNLYETTFPDSHIEAMMCLLGLLRVLEKQGKPDELRLAQEKIQQLNIQRRTVEHAALFAD